MGERGNVRFLVLGDGRALYESPIVKGSDPAPREVVASVAGVKRLVLKVVQADQLDLGAAANWGSARVLRGGKSGGQ
jgi:alpha-glucosidase